MAWTCWTLCWYMIRRAGYRRSRLASIRTLSMGVALIRDGASRMGFIERDLVDGGSPLGVHTLWGITGWKCTLTRAGNGGWSIVYLWQHLSCSLCLLLGLLCYQWRFSSHIPLLVRSQSRSMFGSECWMMGDGVFFIFLRRMLNRNLIGK